MMKKGERLPYQDPALKYFPDEFAGSATMYINNYADVRTCYNTQAYGLSRMLLNVLSISVYVHTSLFSYSRMKCYDVG